MRQNYNLLTAKMCTKEPPSQHPVFIWFPCVVTSFAYDVIDPCDLLGIPAKYGLIPNSNAKNVPPSFPILYSTPLTFVLPQDKKES